MKKIVLLAPVLWLSLTALSLCVVGLLSLQIAYASPYTSIDIATAYNMITNGSYPDLVVLDVRRQDEYDGGHIYGAVCIPHTELEARIGELAGHENHEIIVYCLSGGRSATASGILDSYNFTKVYNMVEGIWAWQDAGYPVWIATVHNVNTTFNYDTIQAAIDAPQTLDGHTILVDAGTYYEHVVVNKPVSLIGENKYNTIVDGNFSGTVMNITATNVNITSFTIQNSEPSYPGFGIYAFDLSGINIYQNIVMNNWGGIYLYDCSNSVICYNNASSNSDFGVRLDYSKNNIVTDNSASKNYRGIGFVGGSSDNSVGGNLISNNSRGIALYSFSHHNNVTTNVISNNTFGIALYSSSHDNQFFHNNLLNNTVQIEIEIAFNNTWDNGYPSGGNYWSDYIAIANDAYSGPFQDETGSDGIGDTAYTIDANNTDNYPLMGMFSDFNATSEHHVQTICNSSISDFQFNGTAISFNVSGENNTTGFCRICIPTALMNETYKVFVNGTEVPYTLLPCSNSMHSYLYFTYNHSTQGVIIIPEFPTWMSMLLILIVLTVATAIYKRRPLKTPAH